MTLVISMVLLSGCGSSLTRSYIDPASHSYEVSTDVELVDEEAAEEAAEEAITVIENNLAYAEDENLEGYLSTIASVGHENTKDELSAFFEEYDLEHTILSVTVLDQQPDRMLIEVEQQSIATYTAEGAEEYRDHVSVANHTLVLETDEWVISETIMTETFFID